MSYRDNLTALRFMYKIAGSERAHIDDIGRTALSMQDCMLLLRGQSRSKHEEQF